FTLTARAVTREPGTRFAARMRKAAADRSPGIANSKPAMCPSQAVGSSWTTVPNVRIGAPSASSKRSVWSRETVGSLNSVAPSARKPEIKTAAFTSALAAGLSYSILDRSRRSGRGSIARGAVTSPSRPVPSTSAPRRPKGHRGQKPAQEVHRRAGRAAVDPALGRAKPAEAGARDDDVVTDRVDRRSESPQASGGRQRAVDGGG